MQIVKRTYTVRLFPTKEQVGKLEELSKTRNLLWNTIMSIEQKAFEEKHLLREFDLNNLLPSLKEEHPEFKVLNSKACQRLCKEIYASYRGFFHLVKKDKTAKPPRKVDDVEQFHTVVFNQSGWKFISNEIIRLNGITLKYKGMKSVDFTSLVSKEVRLKKRDGKYFLDIMHESQVEEPKRIVSENKVLAIDLGLKELATGVDNLGNVVVLRNKAARIGKYFGKQISKVKSKLSKKQRNSRSWSKLNKTKKTPLQAQECAGKGHSAYPEQETCGYELQGNCSRRFEREETHVKGRFKWQEKERKEEFPRNLHKQVHGIPYLQMPCKA